MATILVTGGTGTLGRPLVHRLLDDGHDVRSLSRHPHTGRERPRPHSYAVDLRDGTGLPEALAGVDAIVHCASSPTGGDMEAAGRLVQAAKAAESRTWSTSPSSGWTGSRSATTAPSSRWSA